MLWAQGTMQQLQHMHQVMKGETWASIAAKYGVSEQDLQQANKDVKVKKNKPKKGALLVIPDACPTPEPTAGSHGPNPLQPPPHRCAPASGRGK